MKGLWLFAWILFPNCLMSLDLQPWLTTAYEIETHGSILYQKSSRIGHRHRVADDIFAFIGAEGAIGDTWAVEAEFVLADTHRQRWDFDNFSLTGRYKLLDDIVEDPVSLITSLTLTKAFHHSVHDVSSFFHHGKFAAEIDASIGKELCDYRSFWLSRIWGVFGFGIAEKGSPWVRLDISWEKNWWDVHQLAFKINTLWGLGHKKLRFPKHFEGYGLIRHQSIDVGIEYRRFFESSLQLELGYARRIIANNCPKGTNLVFLKLTYPFGL